MSKLHDYLMDLKEQQEELIHLEAMKGLGWNAPVEIGSDAGAELTDIAEAIRDYQNAIERAEGEYA
ncbi:MAG: hypothetical protein IJD81_04900 [Oscillospiraceae bacterium]|nr:hypothetical protein [Oscillospiraceae bacterium]